MRQSGLLSDGQGWPNRGDGLLLYNIYLALVALLPQGQKPMSASGLISDGQGWPNRSDGILLYNIYLAIQAMGGADSSLPCNASNL